MTRQKGRSFEEVIGTPMKKVSAYRRNLYPLCIKANRKRPLWSSKSLSGREKVVDQEIIKTDFHYLKFIVHVNCFPFHTVHALLIYRCVRKINTGLVAEEARLLQ